MIYELRVYQPVPGQMPKLLARFRDKLLPIWERHGIRPIGFWTTLVGESSNELTYMLPWESLADRETRWTAFQNDPAWHKVRDDSERDGPIDQQPDPNANAFLAAEIISACPYNLSRRWGAGIATLWETLAVIYDGRPILHNVR